MREPAPTDHPFLDPEYYIANFFRPRYVLPKKKANHMIVLHDLILRDRSSRLGAIHRITRPWAGIHVLDKRNAQGTTAILVAGELSCSAVSSCLPC